MREANYPPRGIAVLTGSDIEGLVNQAMSLASEHLVPAPVPVAYNVTEAARALRVSTSTVRRLIKEGLLGVTFVGQRQIIPRAALEQFLDEHTKRSTPDP